MKNIRHANSQYTRHLISSPLILKAYNYRMGGVDKHDRLEGQIPIQLTSKRGYLRVFFHLLDTALVNAWIMFRTTIQARGSGMRQQIDAIHQLGSKNQSSLQNISPMLSIWRYLNGLSVRIRAICNRYPLHYRRSDDVMKSSFSEQYSIPSSLGTRANNDNGFSNMLVIRIPVIRTLVRFTESFVFYSIEFFRI